MSETSAKKLTQDQLKELRKHLARFKKDASYKRPRNTPMAKDFGEISDYLDGYDTANDKISFLYKKLPTNEQKEHSLLICKRIAVVNRLMDYLWRIHQKSVQVTRSSFISIPVYDMKTVEQLVNVMVIEGVYSCLPDGVGIPLEKRRMKNFTVPLEIHAVPFTKGIPILDSIVSTLIKIFSEKSDLRDLIQVGSGFTDALTSAIVLTINPSNSKKDKEKYSGYVKILEDASSTYQLFSLYTLLIAASGPSSRRNALSALFRSFVLERLSKLLVERSNSGVQAMIDVVMGLRNDDNIDISRISQVVKVIVSCKPKHMDDAEYFNNICGQLYDLLVFVNRPVMTTIAAAVIKSLFDKNPKIVTDFLFKRVWQAFNPELASHSPDAIVLTSEVQLNNAFNVAISFSRQLISQDFSNTMFKPLIVPLWGYLIYQKKQKKDFILVEETLVSVLSLEQRQDGFEMLSILVDNLYSLQGSNWQFAEGDNGLTIIKEVLSDDKAAQFENHFLSILDDVDLSLELFSDLLRSLYAHDPEKLDFVFTRALKKWMVTSDDTHQLLEGDDDPVEMLMNLKLVQMIVENFKDELAASPDGLLEFVMLLLSKKSTGSSSTIPLGAPDSDDEDEIDNSRQDNEAVNTALDILSTVLSVITASNSFTKNTLKLLKQLDEALSLSDEYASYGPLKDQVKILVAKSSSLETKDNIKKKEEDRLLEKAMKSINDPVPAVRIYGMQLVRQLVHPSVNKVSINFAMKMHLNQLKDEEPFVYFNAIKGMETLLSMNVKQVLPECVKIYAGIAKNPVSLDERLRIGEVFVRYFEKTSSSITEETISTLLVPLMALVSKKEGNKPVDNRLRMSAMSIIGSICHNVPIPELLSPFLSDVVDLITGILTFEKGIEESVMRRSAIVVISDIITSKNGLSLLGPYGARLEESLKYITENDNDVLVRNQAKEVLYIIDESFERKFEKDFSLHS
ncbi:hypothetical protein FOA43_003695 [Brettanomyces nanus]|uniref:Uncharacterized protein n=1 Tax=Eeniella nana TaxID=13502 RepID=A0A875S9K0_EENNA|nr:uncharacterized protein FOA43_003695 [Brettanomyces nanus]QPG76309.1 hypothetical protein FOA43_003695 [Brettanomyces nanus]